MEVASVNGHHNSFKHTKTSSAGKQHRKEKNEASKLMLKERPSAGADLAHLITNETNC